MTEPDAETVRRSIGEDPALPVYIARAIRSLSGDVEALRAAKLLADGLLRAAERGETGAESAGETGDEGGSVVIRRVSCGDESCKCASGEPADMHGPYKYLVTSNDGERSWNYIGKAEEADA